MFYEKDRGVLSSNCNKNTKENELYIIREFIIFFYWVLRNDVGENNSSALELKLKYF